MLNRLSELGEREALLCLMQEMAVRHITDMFKELLTEQEELPKSVSMDFTSGFDGNERVRSRMYTSKKRTMECAEYVPPEFFKR